MAPGSDPQHGSVEPFFVGLREPTLKGSFIRGSDSLADNPAVNVFRPTTHDRRHAESWRHAGLRIALAALLLTGLAQPSAWASDSRDHERARSAVQAGQVLPLEVDAATAQVLEVKRKYGRKAERDSSRQVTPSKESPKMRHSRLPGSE